MNDRHRALICEDDPAIRTLVRTVIEREGYVVEVAVDGIEALEKLKRECFEVVVLDLMMPGLDGYGVIGYLKANDFSTLKRVVVMTAATDALRNDFPEPVCTILRKPFEIRLLIDALRSCTIECQDDALAG